MDQHSITSMPPAAAEEDASRAVLDQAVTAKGLAGMGCSGTGASSRCSCTPEGAFPGCSCAMELYAVPTNTSPREERALSKAACKSGQERVISASASCNCSGSLLKALRLDYPPSANARLGRLVAGLAPGPHTRADLYLATLPLQVS